MVQERIIVPPMELSKLFRYLEIKIILIIYQSLSGGLWSEYQRCYKPTLSQNKKCCQRLLIIESRERNTHNKVKKKYFEKPKSGILPKFT